MPLYHACREKFPELNSKVLQNFLRFHFVSPNKDKKPKHKAPKASIIIDYQSFGLIFDDTIKLTNLWLRFHRKNFALLGKFLLSRIENPNDLKLVQIYNRRNKLYCKLSIRIDKEIKDLHSSSKAIGLDVNSKRIVLSNNDFYHLKKLYHRKMEPKKNNQKNRNLENYTKDTVHKLTTRIAKDLHKNDLEVLVMENLRDMRRSSSRKLGTSKGKKVNYIVNSLPYRMFQSFLEYKCLDRGINVVYVDPAYTSTICSLCGSINTDRRQTSPSGVVVHVFLNITLMYISLPSNSKFLISLSITNLFSKSLKKYKILSFVQIDACGSFGSFNNSVVSNILSASNPTQNGFSSRSILASIL